MSKVVASHAVSVDGFITGHDPGPGRGLGDGGVLFDWYFTGDTAGQVFSSFRLSEPSLSIFDSLARNVGASLAGRNTYDDSGWDAGGTPHPDAPLVLLTHREAPAHERQTVVTSGIEDAVAVARSLAGDKDVALMGGGVTQAALDAGLVDEIWLHQVPVLLGGGRPFFPALQARTQLRLAEAVPAPGVTHLHYAVAR